MCLVILKEVIKLLGRCYVEEFISIGFVTVDDGLILHLFNAMGLGEQDMRFVITNQLGLQFNELILMKDNSARLTALLNLNDGAF